MKREMRLYWTLCVALLMVVWMLPVKAQRANLEPARPRRTTSYVWTPEIAARLDTYLSAYARVKQFSGVVLIARDGVPLFRRAYGFAEVGRLRNTPETRFMIFSMTKQFTAAAILLLHERKLLNVHDKVGKYLTDLPAVWNDVTIHHLLTHTSGVDSDEMYAWQQGRGRRNRASNQRVYHIPKTTPGRTFAYSNRGYVTLGLIITAVTGRTYQDFMQNTLFQPLHMTHTGCDHPDEVVQRAYGYRSDGDTLSPHEQDTDTIVGAGDIYSNVDDLLLWDQALYTEKPISSAMRHLMFTAYKNNFGYGWDVSAEAGRQCFSHGGQGAGFSSEIFRYPQSRTLVVILANIDLPEDTTFAFTDVCAAAFGQKLRAPHLVQVPEPVRNSYIGLYSGLRSSHTIIRQGRSLYDATREEVLTPISNTLFTSSDGARYLFRHTGNNALTLSIVHSGRTFHGLKTPIHIARWGQYIGMYRYPKEGGVTIRQTKQGTLIMEVTPAVHPNLIPLTDVRFFVQGLDFQVVFKQDKHGKVRSMEMLGEERTLRLRKIPQDQSR